MNFLKWLNPIALFGFFLDMVILHVVDDIKSTVITNAGASPLVLSKAQIARGREINARGVCTLVTAAAEAGSKMHFFRVKSNDLVSRLLLDNTSCGVGCTLNIGLYQTEENGGAVVDADLFASGVDINTAQRALDVTRESGVITVANMEKCIWELLGLSADPQIEYEVVGTLAVAAAAAGTACLSGTVVGRT